MRIDHSQLTNAQIANEQSTKKVSGQPVGSVNSTESEDRTTFASDQSSVSSLVGKAMSSPDIRQELVSQLKQQVSSGQYSIDPDAIASSMLNEQA